MLLLSWLPQQWAKTTLTGQSVSSWLNGMWFPREAKLQAGTCCPQLAGVLWCPPGKGAGHGDWAACEDSQQSNPVWKLLKQMALVPTFHPNWGGLDTIQKLCNNPLPGKGSESILLSQKTWMLAALDFLEKIKVESVATREHHLTPLLFTEEGVPLGCAFKSTRMTSEKSKCSFSAVLKQRKLLKWWWCQVHLAGIQSYNVSSAFHLCIST